MKHVQDAPRIRLPGLASAAAAVAVLLLAACGGSRPDTTAPTIQVTSPDTSPTAAYTLTGLTTDNTGTTAVTWSLAGSVPQNAALSGNEFSANLVLTLGDNVITVTAGDAAGNESSVEFSVLHNASPDSLTLDTDVAARGESVTVTGANFGATSGSVDIGGVAATIDDWSDTQVTLIVPGDAPHGPQELTVHGPYGSSSARLFVGVDFPAGSLDELAALDLPRGTAVRLAAADYEGGPDGTLVLDNLSLYGQGVYDTVLHLGAAVALEYRADFGQQLVIEHLTISGDNARIGPGPLQADSAGATAQPGPQAIPHSSVTIRNSEWAEAAGGGVVRASSPHGGYAGDLIFEDVTIDAPSTEFYFEFQGSLALDNVVADAEVLWVILPFGHLTAHGSTVTTQGGILFHTDFGYDIADTELTATGGILDIYHNNGNNLSTGSRAIFRDSTFTVLNSDMVWGFGPATEVVLENATIESRYGFYADFYDNTGTSLQGSAVAAPDSNFVVAFHEQASAELRDNTFAAPAGLSRLVLGDGTTAVLTGNTINTSQGALGFEIHQGAELEMSGANTLYAGTSLYVEVHGGTFDANGNTFHMGYGEGVAGSILWLDSSSVESSIVLANNLAYWFRPGGLGFGGGGNLTITANEIDGYGLNAGATALTILQGDPAYSASISVTDNYFTLFDNALEFWLAGAAAAQFDVTIHHNVFDFPIDASPQVARVDNSHNSDLDARFNVWGENTSSATVESYINHTNSTSLLHVEPITQPAP